MPGMTPAGDPGGILEREVEASQVDDQAQVLDVGRPVLPVGVVAPTRPREPSRALVEAHRVGRDADRVREFADPSCGQQTLEWLRCQGRS